MRLKFSYRWPCGALSYRMEFPSTPSCFLLPFTSEFYPLSSADGQADRQFLPCFVLPCWDRTQDWCGVRLANSLLLSHGPGQGIDS